MNNPPALIRHGALQPGELIASNDFAPTTNETSDAPFPSMGVV